MSVFIQQHRGHCCEIYLISQFG